MDVLKNESYATYDYLSRYIDVPYYYHSIDKKYIYGIGSNMFKNIAYTLHQVEPEDTLDSLALQYYNNPTLYWIIAYFNDIQDCFVKLFDSYKTIKIPTYTAIQFGDDR